MATLAAPSKIAMGINRSQSNNSQRPRVPSGEMLVRINSKKVAPNFRCPHAKKPNTIGDGHLVNCNLCGAYFPKSGSAAIRALKRHARLNKLYTSDLLRSVYASCQQKQANKEQHLKISAQYVEVRNLIIDWLVEVCEALRLDISKSAYHAVCLLDRYLSAKLRKHRQEMDQAAIMLQALCCLFISAKNLEKDPLVPSSRRFLRQLPGYKPTQTEQANERQIYQAAEQSLTGAPPQDNMRFNAKRNELTTHEGVILNEVGFELDTFPTFFDVVEIFMAQGVVFSTDRSDGQPLEGELEERMARRIEKYVDFFVLLSLQDHKLVNTNQYLIACSIISAARAKMGLDAGWSVELEQLTGLQQSHFCNIERRLLTKFEQSSEKKAKLQDTIKRPKKVDEEESRGGRLDSKLTAGPSAQ
jgi:hypothetical protein